MEPKRTEPVKEKKIKVITRGSKSITSSLSLSLARCARELKKISMLLSATREWSMICVDGISARFETKASKADQFTYILHNTNNTPCNPPRTLWARSNRACLKNGELKVLKWCFISRFFIIQVVELHTGLWLNAELWASHRSFPFLLVHSSSISKAFALKQCV